MTNVRLAFGMFDRNKDDIPPGYQEVKCHMIFDIRMGENRNHSSITILVCSFNR
jgi:hypothetical protein